MSLESDLRLWVCQYRQVPNYPITAFDLWFKRLGVRETDILEGLNKLQDQLDREAQVVEALAEGCSQAVVQHQYWCYYCAQLRAHYRLRHRVKEGGGTSPGPH
ncbi:hypothetical protein [Marinimicrobium locisalis]|uniref:hypothetical protein n=1 Tax=Marinimicrobium locisalis TaxID=546022 RepID=UPI003221A156